MQVFLAPDEVAKIMIFYGAYAASRVFAWTFVYHDTSALMKSSWSKDALNVVRCVIWYHLYNLENVENTHGGVLILVKLQSSSLQLY